MAALQGKCCPETLKVLYTLNKFEMIYLFKFEDSIPSPVLKLKSGLELTSANAAARFLMDVDCGSGGVDLLEWEFYTLRVLVADVMKRSGSEEVDLALSTELKNCLLLLEKEASCDYGLFRNEVVEAVIFCCLAPLFKLKRFTGGVKLTKLMSLFGKFAASDAFRISWREVCRGGSGKEDFQNYFNKFKIYTETATLKEIPKNRRGSAEAADEEENAKEVTAEEKKLSEEVWKSGKCCKRACKPSPVLPVSGERNVLITAALPYVNNIPHLGNIIGCVLSADVYARYCRTRGWNTLYIGGTDEYGTATETKAAQEGCTPKQICDKYNKMHAEVYQWFNIDFDSFGRTTTQKQTEICQEIFWDLHKNGYLSEQVVEQLYCDKCERFLADRFVEGTCPLVGCGFEDARGDQCDGCGKLINAIELIEPRCKLCSASPKMRSSTHLFVNLGQLSPKLEAYLKQSFTNAGWSPNARAITESWLRDGLKPRCITRDLKWGTPVPMKGFTDKVFYVWFDAPIGYLSITANYTDQWEKWWKNPKEVELYQFIGKDNVPFHSVIFPSSLLGTGVDYTIVNHLNATEYLNYEGQKFSKSRGVGVFGDQAARTGIDSDIWRFYLLYMRPETTDTQFFWNDFMVKNNSELLNNLGNFINRSLKFVANFYDGKIPEACIADDDLFLMSLVNRELQSYLAEMDRIKIRDCLKRILAISRLGNQYLQDNQPWKLLKGSDAEKKRAATVTCVGANLTCLLSILLEPYMPATSAVIWNQLNLTKDIAALAENAAFSQYLPTGHQINKPAPLFKKLDESLLKELKEKFAGKQQPKQEEKKEENKKSSGDGATQPPAPLSPEEIASIESQVTAQGELVRKLKEEAADVAEIKKQVVVLLDLKKKLALAKGEDPNAGGKKKKGKKNKK